MVRATCVRCGSGTGVLGDIGQGTEEARRNRGYVAGGDRGEELEFECLVCGAKTGFMTRQVRPECLYCGCKDGVLIVSQQR